MPESPLLSHSVPVTQRPWDARLARRLVTPLKDSRATPNHLTTVRLAVGLAAAAAFLPGTYGWTNIGALLMVLSNFLDHTDGELARISGRRPATSDLTTTETRLAALAAEGLSNKEIAAALHISVHTVEAHLTRIYRKLGIHSRAALARRLNSSQVLPGPAESAGSKSRD